MGVQEHERLPSTASRPFDQIFPICMRAGFKSESPEHDLDCAPNVGRYSSQDEKGPGGVVI